MVGKSRYSSGAGGLRELALAWRQAGYVWKAIFLREALVRLFGSRAAWVWMVLEPVVHVLWLILIFSAVRVQHIGGIDSALWLALGMLVFMTFKRTLVQVQNAVEANSALFTYRQVQPADVALVRAVFEGVCMVVIGTVMLFIGGLAGWLSWPGHFLGVLQAALLAWLCAMGLGMVFAVLTKLMPETGRVVNFLLMPLMMISGVMFPLSMVSQPYLQWLLWNPLAHAIELARLGFAPYYHSVAGVSLHYLSACALVLVFLGLAMFRRFKTRLVMQ